MGANAQTSVPTFTAGEILTAANMNISARTGIPVFATSVTRDAAFGGTGEKTLAEGQFAYLEDSNTTQYYDGAAWQSVGGLTLLSTTSFTTVTSVSLPANSFSATYQNYKVQILVTATTAQSTLTARFRTAGTDNSTARYNSASAGRDSAGAAANINNSDTTAFDVGTNFSTGAISINLDIFDPFSATQTLGNGFYSFDGTPAGANLRSSPVSILFRNNTSFDSFTVISSVASSMTGVARVYGYTNS